MDLAWAFDKQETEVGTLPWASVSRPRRLYGLVARTKSKIAANCPPVER